MKKIRFILPVIACSPLLLAGCAEIADSSASSASISSISASSTAMMASLDSAFQEDVQIAAAASAESGASGAEMMRTVAKVAEEHGVTDWEAHPATFLALGRGLKMAGIDENRVEVLTPELAGSNAEAARYLMEGFRSS